MDKGKRFERWVADYYGKADGLALRTGHLVDDSGLQSGADVRTDCLAIQCKKGTTAVPTGVVKAVAAANRSAGRHVPVAVLAPDGDNQGHYVALRGSDFKRIIDTLRRHGLTEEILVGGTFR